MKPAHILAHVLIGLATSIAVALVVEALRERKELAASRLPEPLAPGHDSA